MKYKIQIESNIFLASREKWTALWSNNFRPRHFYRCISSIQNKIPSQSKNASLSSKRGTETPDPIFCLVQAIEIIGKLSNDSKKISNLQPACSQHTFLNAHSASFFKEQAQPQKPIYPLTKKTKHWQPNDPSFATESSWFMATSPETEEG